MELTRGIELSKRNIRYLQSEIKDLRAELDSGKHYGIVFTSLKIYERDLEERIKENEERLQFFKGQEAQQCSTTSTKL